MLVQPFDQAFLLRPVLAALVEYRRAIAGRFDEGAVTWFGQYRIDAGEQIGEVDSERFERAYVRASSQPCLWYQPMNTG